jgi:hypothetical protein
VSKPGGKQELWGVVPDALTQLTILYGSGREAPLPFSGTGVFDVVNELPGALTWTTDGEQHWFDTTRVACTRHCLDLPVVPGL